MSCDFKCGITPEDITELKKNEVFVFGSNLAGVHGAGAAHTAVKWGAAYGVGEGLSGKTYALPTKDYNINTRSIRQIYDSVVMFLVIVLSNKDKHFLVTKIGCGLAGYDVKDIAPLFRVIAKKCDNVSLPIEFINFLQGKNNV